MADPVSIAIIAGVSMAATAAGGAVSAYGSYAGGRLEQQMFEYRKAIALQNARYETQLGERRAGEKGLEQAQISGKIMAAQGGSGINVSSESSQKVREGQRAVAKIEQQDIRSAAARRAWNEQTQGELYGQAGRQAKWAGNMKAISTVLGTTASVANKWLGASSSGAFGGGSGSGDLYQGMSGDLYSVDGGTWATV